LDTATKTKHTPGPWNVFDCGSDDNLRVETNGHGSIAKIARKGPDARDRDQELVNARLIAAAPALLEALESCLGCLQMECDECPGCISDPCTQCRAKAAIRLAKGDSL
jgi:hypothetical protein